MSKLLWQYQKEWGLTQQALNNFLQQLNPDLERAGEKYENIRQKLVKFFEYRGCAFPDEYADETINRVIRKINEGEVIRAANLYDYFYGVAKNVLREQWKKSDKNQIVLCDLSLFQHSLLDPIKVEQQEAEKQKHEQQLECLKHCLQKLPAESREMIIQYYSEEGRVGIENRQALAQRLGIPLNNLRVQMHRMREKLEKCVQKCLK
jgi:RNA polymerase sigma factor (sigma-70 family)